MAKKEQAIDSQLAEEITFKSGYSKVNGLNMYYEIHGAGNAPLVLIHGGGSTINTTFGRILPLLSKYNRIIAFELQGHGHTSDRDSSESFEQDAEDVVALLSNLQIRKASFLGFSNGGNTSMQIAFRHPEMVDKLILASTFYRREGMVPGFFEGMEQATIEMMPKELKDAFLQINPDPGKLQTMFEKDRERMVKFTDWGDSLLSSVKAPTLIINGDKDVILPEHAVKMSHLIKGSRLMILPAFHGSYIGVKEIPDPDEKMIELTAAIISDFLNKTTN